MVGVRRHGDLRAVRDGLDATGTRDSHAAAPRFVPVPITPEGLVAILGVADAMVGETPAHVLGDARVADAALALASRLARVLAPSAQRDPAAVAPP